MRRALRRAGWALAAAGGIGIAAPALAQTQPVRIIGPGGHVEQAGEVVVMTESRARFEEAQVELGLLADPMLFSYGLGARVQGSAVELRGFVPTEEVREQALTVAREHTALHVVDRLKLQPNLVTRSSVDKPERIQRAAKELIEDAIPQYGRGIDVKCDARGRVTVSGTIGSYEDRVLVSRKLRQVNGCSCVANQLDVVPAGGETHPAETSGAVLIPDAPPMTTRPAVRKTEPAVPAVPARTVAAPSFKEIETPSLGMPRVDMGPVAKPSAPPVPAPAVTPLPELPPVAKPVLPPSRSSIDITPLLPPPVKVETPLPPPTPHQPVPSVDKDRPYGSGTVGASTLELPPPVAPKPQPAVKLPVVVNEPAVPAPKPPPLPPVVPLTPKPAAAPLPRLPVIEKHDHAVGEESSFSEGTITFDDDPPPARPVVPAKPPTSPPKSLPPSPKASSVKPADGTLTLTPPPMPSSRMTAGPMKLSAPPAKPPAPPAPPRPSVPPAVRLKERIQGVIGEAYEVKVTSRGKNHLQLEIAGRVAGEETRVMKQIKPVLESEEFHGVELNIDVIMPVK